MGKAGEVAEVTFPSIILLLFITNTSKFWHCIGIEKGFNLTRIVPPRKVVISSCNFR